MRRIVRTFMVAFIGGAAPGPLTSDALADPATSPGLACDPTSSAEIAFVSDRAGAGNPEIYSVKTDGTCLARLTNDPHTDEEPTWSPDGLRIAFVSDRSGAPAIYVMNADGSNVVQRTFSGSYTHGPTWSPDGTKIAYSTWTNGNAGLWVVSPDAGGFPPTLLFDGPGWDAHPAWSPDGVRLALVSDWHGYDVVWDIFLVNADGSGFTALTGPAFDETDFVMPSWSPNGTQLAVAITTVDDNGFPITVLGVMNSDGTGLTWLVGTSRWTRTSWSPDGQRIAYTSHSRDIVWIQADGSSNGKIIPFGWNPSWRH